ncbi:PucR family transcriptional regulator [Heyndrickxia coagulans]|uniref:PucR family transcriptional regulator n=1 Tax=Heyndrickxia coagulans TaxID=1398 RepID=UPI003D20692C
MKVFELLAIPELAGMKLIAGERGKDHEIQTVNMMDAPDIVHFLKPDVFLVTTAYHFKDHPGMLADLVAAMSERGCAVLGIKTKRFLQEVPAEVLELADRLSFPVIELPLELSLGEIVNHTLRAILDKHAQDLTIALEAHKRFTAIIMKGRGIHPLLQELSKMIQHPVQFIDPKTKGRTGYGQAFSVLESVLPARIPNESWSEPLLFSVLSNRQTYHLFPMYIREKHIGYLAVYGEIERTDHLSALMIEQAINVISFAYMKEQALKQHARSIRNDFFLHFLEGAFSSQEEIINRAAEFSLPNHQAYICAVGKMDETTGTVHPDDVYALIEEEITAQMPHAHFFKKGEHCILLFEAEETVLNPVPSIEAVLRRIQENVSGYFQQTISFGISNLCHTFLQVKNAYKEAADALIHGRMYKKTAFIQAYLTKDVMELLRLIPEDDLKNFYTFALNGFTGLKPEEQQSLFATLSVFLETNCQISETAKRLYVHRNTVVYRIEKCEELLGKRIRDPETNLQLRLALRIKSLIETAG